MADWDKFWELVDRAAPAEAVKPSDSSKGIYGDYLPGQFVKEQLNQVCRESGLRWYVDWSTVRTGTMQENFRYFVAYMTGDLVVTDGTIQVRRPGMGVGRCMCPFDRDKQEILQSPADHQMDTVMKTSLTDFIKNAAMRFGRYFGGELYFDERIAGVLGWEVASSSPRRTDAVPPADLGSYRIREDGWGKEHKFGGMTLEEVYTDTDGYGAMSWASRLSDATGDTKKMAQYFNQREQEEEGGVPDGVSLEEFDESVTAGAGLVTRERAEGINHLLQDNVGDGKLFGHTNHVRNHLKSHYNVAKVVDLTREKAVAFVRYIESNGQDADSRWYAEPEIPVPAVVEPAEFHSGEAIAGPTEQLFGTESIEDLLRVSAPHLPEAWQDKPERWWAGVCNQFSIGIMNAKQLVGARILLKAVASGGIDLKNVGSDTYAMFLGKMKGIADDG